ncbi:MAG: class I SAM-dependent methyltransferase [Pseudomonadota bacterium]
MTVNFDYDAIPIGYYDSVYRRATGVQSKWHHLKFAAFRRAMAGARDHLDIGCGPGTFIATLEGGIRSRGIDIAQPQIDFARSHYAGGERSFEVAGDLPLPYEDDSFDAITIIELIEHLPAEQNQALIAEALRVLRPDGKLLVSTPNYGSCWPIIEALVNRLGPTSYEDQHITHYRRASLHRLLEAAGGRAVSVRPYMGLAAFTAPFGWRFADAVAEFETPWLEGLYGLLLFAEARKRP